MHDSLPGDAAGRGHPAKAGKSRPKAGGKVEAMGVGSARFWVVVAVGVALATLATLAPCAAGADSPLPRQEFLVDGRPAFIIAPTKKLPGPTPWVLYAPTLGKGLPGGSEQWMFQQWLDAGIAIAGVDVGESYGSPKGRATYNALHKLLTEQHGFAAKASLLARSRGGLMLYCWAAENPEKVRCIAGIYPVCNLESYPGLARACGAYGMTEAQLKAELARHNPVDRLAPLAKAGVPIFHIHGDKDGTVPLADNSALLASRYREAGGTVTLQIAEGQGHNMWRGFFECQGLVDFVLRGGAAAPATQASKAAPAAHASGAGAETLRVLSYNIHTWQPSVEALAGVIKASGADIVGLNEAWDQKRNDALAEKLGYNIVYGGCKPAKAVERQPHWVNGYYMPQVLLTRHKIVSAKFFNAMAAKEEKSRPDFDPNVPIYRGGTLAVLETARGNRLAVFVLHLHPWGGGDNEKMIDMRVAEIKGILAQLTPYAKLPILVIGDHNTQSHKDGPTNYKVTRQMESAGYTDLYRTVHPDPKASPGLTCSGARIDYIFCNKHVTPVDCKVVTAGVFGSLGPEQSDHLAVFGTVKIGPTGKER
jgi:endonuclease/exonuclease/phosphatase family metal-dependent hydrolase/pimeloyl-ACP methyl ester carboxylesterase